MTEIAIVDVAGSFAEDKDVARNLRRELLLPALERGELVTLDFAGVDLATQSFVHALVSDAIRRLGPKALDQIIFKNCSEVIRTLVEIVSEYSQEGLTGD
jgi:hypothetical protein